MGYEPLMPGDAQSNVFGEHLYCIRCTFGVSSVVTFRSKDATIAKTTTTTFTITLPKNYAEITRFAVGQKVAASVIPLAYVITANNVTTGTIVLTSCETAASGAPTAPASGDVIYIMLGVSADPLNDKFVG